MQRKAVGLGGEVLVGLLLNLTSGLFPKNQFLVSVTKWAWMLVACHFTYLLISGRWGRRRGLALRSRIGGRHMVWSYAVAAVLSAAVGIVYWYGINAAYRKLQLEEQPRPVSGPVESETRASTETAQNMGSRSAPVSPEAIADVVARKLSSAMSNDQRHISRTQAADMLAAMKNFPAASVSSVAVYTVKKRTERIQYATEIANIFREAGWTILQRNDHEQRKMPPLVNLIDDPLDDEKDGISLLYMKGGDPPRRIVSQVRLDPVLAALRAGRIKHQEVEVMFLVYLDPIDTSTPLIYVGPAKENAGEP